MREFHNFPFTAHNIYIYVCVCIYKVIYLSIAPTMYVHIFGTVFKYTAYVISFTFSATWNGVTNTEDE